MKTIIITALLASLGSLSQAQTLQLDQNTIDYGTVAQGSNGVRSVEISNTGTVPLVIASIKPSCSCSVADWPRSPIAPGERIQIDLKYNTKRIGPFIKYFTINSNDKEQPMQRIKIHGMVADKSNKAATTAVTQ